VKKSFILIPLLLTGCARLPVYIEPTTNVPSVRLVANQSFDAPFLGYSTFVDVHTEKNTCGEPSDHLGSFDSKSAARLIVLDIGNPLIGDINADGVNLPAGTKHSFMITSVAGGTSCTVFASYTPKVQHSYKLDVSGVLLGFTAKCKAELYSTDLNTNVTSPVDFEYYGQCRE